MPKRITPFAPNLSHRKLSQHSAVPIAAASAARMPQPISAPAVIATPIPKMKRSIRRSMALDSASVAIFLVRCARHFQNLAQPDAKAEESKHERENEFRVQPMIEQIANPPAHKYRHHQRERYLHGDGNLLRHVTRILSVRVRLHR